MNRLVNHALHDPGFQVIDHTVPKTLKLNKPKLLPISRSSIRSQRSHLNSSALPKSVRTKSNVKSTKNKTQSGFNSFQYPPLDISSLKVSGNESFKHSIDKVLALQQHPLWIEALKVWWNILDPHEEQEDSRESGTRGYLTPEQFMDLYVRIKKCTSQEFEYEAVCEKGWNECMSELMVYDHEIRLPDIEDGNNATPIDTIPDSIIEDSKHFNFDRVSEFIYKKISEICEELNIPQYLITLNTWMLSITKGLHLATSVFRQLDKIKPIPQMYYDIISELSKNPSHEDFMKWYKANFGHIAIIRDSVVHLLYQIFPQEPRIEDIFIEREYSTINETIVACTRRLSAYLDRIQQSLPINEAAITKTLTNTSYITLPKLTSRTESKSGSQKPRPKPYIEKTIQLPPINEEPICHYNRFEYLRIIKFLLIGTSIYPKPRKEVNIQTVTRSDFRRDISSSSVYSSVLSSSKLEINVPNPKIADVFVYSEDSNVSILQSKHTTFHDISLARYSELKQGENNRPYTSPAKGNKRLVYFRSHSVVFDPEVGVIKPKIRRRTQGSPILAEDLPFVPRFTQTEEVDRSSTTKKNEHKEDTKELETLDNESSQSGDIKVLSSSVIHTEKKDLNSESDRQFRLLRGENVTSIDDMFRVNLERAKFNQKYQSEFLKSHRDKVIYESRRDEMGFGIALGEWKLFIYKLRKTISAVQKRKKLRRRHKLKRRKRVPRVPGPNILWRKVFIHTQQPKHETELQRKYYHEINSETLKSKLPASLAAVINSSTHETTRRLVPTPPPIPPIKSYRKHPSRFMQGSCK